MPPYRASAVPLTPAAWPRRIAAALLCGLPWGSPAMSADQPNQAASAYAVEGRSMGEVEADLAAGRVTASALVRAYTARIAAIDGAGPSLHAVLVLNPDAASEAEASDRRRAGGHALPLDGVPVLVKDNIETRDRMPTTAGSLALQHNVTGRDSPLVARLRAAGAVILGKTNLSEWANMRGSRSVSGWSGVGGLTRNAFALDRSACGSSSGSGVAVSASLAAAAIGTETDGSVTCPASISGLVGLKPTVGLIPRTHIIPISATQDTAGPMTRTVTDAARLLGVIAGSDPSDPATRDADAHRTDYVAALDAGALKGRRIGVMRFAAGYHPELDAAFDAALAVLRQAGAILVEIPSFPDLDALGADEQTVLLCELKDGLNAYLAGTPVKGQPATLSALIAFNQAHHDRELGLFGQELFLKAEATKGLDDPAYRTARDNARRRAGPEGIDRMLADGHLDALVAPTGAPAWLIDTVDGDHDMGSASTLPAVAGYPHLTVPMALVSGLPVGLSFIGPAWSEARLLALGYSFEQANRLTLRPGYHSSLGSDPASLALLRPASDSGAQ